MLSYEKYEKNVKTDDKYSIKDIKISKYVTFNENLDLLCGKSIENEEAAISPLAAAVVGPENTGAPLPSDTSFANIWTDVDAQEAYLNTKPTSYLILGKPGLGSYSLGESLSKKLNCVHLSSRYVILSEIENNSPTGRCLDFNMRHNKVIKFEHILSMIQIKIQSAVVEHRGYVISGLPLVTSNRRDKYFLNSLFSEESLAIVDDLLYDLIYNLKRKKSKRKLQKSLSLSSASSGNDKVEEEHIEEEQHPEEETEEVVEQPVELPKYLLDLCSDIVISTGIFLTSKKAILLQQMQKIFSFNPDVILHILSPDGDTLIKRSRKYLNYLNNTTTFHYFVSNTDPELRWPIKYTTIDYTKPYDSHIFNPKYNCKLPINFTSNAVDQICNYKNTIDQFVEMKLKDFDTRYILKIDGRTSVNQMLYYVMGKLLLLPIKPVLVPKPLYLEESPEDLDEFWSTVKTLNSLQSRVLNFYRFASVWYNRCPIELKKRRSLQGNPKFAVSFFKHVYLLSSLDAMISFCKNPRPYLKVEYLEPTCRIIIIGTRTSGKTMVAKSLSWLFDTPIICFKTFLKTERQKKFDSYSKSILSEIIATIEDARYLQWQNTETLRTTNLNTWFMSVSNNLKKYVTLMEKYLPRVNEDELSYEEIEIPKSELKILESLKNLLSFLPILDDLELCKEAMLGNNLLNYAPIEFVTETVKPTLPILGDNDVTEAISAYILANDLSKDVEPTTEELMNEIKQLLLTNDEQSIQLAQKYGNFIIDDFPSDPEFWSYLEEVKLLPDYTIILIESREVDDELLQYYDAIDKITKNYQDRYLLSNDPLIKIKKQQTKPLNYSILAIQVIVNGLLDNVFNVIFTEYNSDNVSSEAVTLFREAINKFREESESVKLKLEQNFKAFIVVEMETKSDIEILDEVLLKLRQSYNLSCSPIEVGELEDIEDEYNTVHDMLTYNDPNNFGETYNYCPIAYYDYGVLWEAKSEFGLQFKNKSYYFSKEECVAIFQKDVMKYLSENKPLKKIPPVRICVIGSIGSGKTTLSKLIAKELGLMHVDFEELVNFYLIPRHFKKVGRKYENIFKDSPLDDESVREFQADEENEKIPNILFNENEIRRLIYNYFEKGAPMTSYLIQKLLSLLWFTEPFTTNGFVLDGFPKLPSDVEDMVANYCVPDLVIDLQGSAEKTLERLSSTMLKKWKMQLSEAKNEVKVKFQKERTEWFNLVTKQVVIKLLMDELINSALADASKTNINRDLTMSAQSTIIDAHPSGSANVDANLFNTYNEIIEANPEPVDQSQWEKAEDALERINTRLENIFEINDENIQQLKDIISENKIKLLSIDGNKTAFNVFRRTLPMLSFLKNRNESFFEQTFIINCDIAEILLMEGFYFLSKFNRICPVYISENIHAVSNPYHKLKKNNAIFPVIHRSFIYFLSSKTNVQKFRNNPLKYVKSNIISSYREYPLRIGIIGPPKSGKSELASKLAKRYGLLCISKGQAIRHTLEQMDWTEIAIKMKTQLQLGVCIDTELVINAVNTVIMDHRVVTNGYIMDGFPDSAAEASEMVRMGIYPLIIIEIITSMDTIVRNSQKELYYSILKYKPPYSRSFIEYRNNEWQNCCSGIKKWINDDIQNLYKVNGDTSRWKCVYDATNLLESISYKVNYYLCNVDTNIVPAFVMCFTNEIFEQRMSPFKNLCPVCLRKNMLRHSGFPINKEGMVQLRNILYWFCPEHINLGLSYPDIYLQGNVKLPEIPVVVKTISPALLYENGICIVTYADNLPSQRIVKGDRNFAASYHGRYYLFCSDGCLQKFLAKPQIYYDITVFKEAAIFPKLSLKNLPNLGYLEQTLGNILTQACCAVHVMRPKYPGLDIRVSGLLYVALFLKIHNPLTKESILQLYKKSNSTYEARCQLVHNIRFRLRSMDNPFVKYPRPCSPRKVGTGTVSKPSSMSTMSKTGSSCSTYNKVDSVMALVP